jgi:molybdate transport system substrate-binding protein
VALAAAVTTGVCSCGARPSPAGGGRELVLYCGAGLREPGEDLIAAFGAKHGIAVSATYAGSGRLLGQLAASRHGDVFMPGSSYYVERAIDQGMVEAGGARTAGYFVPVILVRKGNPHGIRTLADLARPKLRVGLGDERAVAVGRRAVELFEKNAIDRNGVTANVVFASGTVNELGVAIEMGTIDAAIVWDATARQYARVGDIVEIPPEQNIVSAIPVAAVSFARDRAGAELFVEFVTSEEGRAILRGHGYAVDAPAAEVRAGE